MNYSDAEFSMVLLHNLLLNHHYASKVLPYLEGSYFVDPTERAICECTLAFHSKHSKVPHPKELVIEMKDLPNIALLDKNVVNEVFGNAGFAVTSNDWLEAQTEKFIRRRRVSQAFEQTYGDFENEGECDSIANTFQEAISFSFDNSVGHSFVNDAEIRFDQYTADEDRLSFMLEMLDLVTNGGMAMGTLNCFLAGTGVGKSLLMCSMAAAHALSGKKVLYLSMEMAELRLAERIEANLMDANLSDLKKMDKSEFTVRQQQYIKKMKANGGDVIFKQYPTGSAHVGHFRNFLIECKNKADLEFDVIYIDYINICASVKSRAGDNSYTRIKNIAEELRALAIEFDLPIITATQTTRDGQNSSDLSIENVSESHGLSATVDLLFGLISNEEWEKLGKIMMKQLKNRYGDLNWYNKFMVGIERSRMRLYDLKREASDECNKGQTQKPENVPGEGLDLSVLGGSSKLDLGKLTTT